MQKYFSRLKPFFFLEKTGQSKQTIPLEQNSQAGYTLVELGIVIVIIGLISGSVVVGQNMIRRAEVQSLIIDAQTYASAAKSFEAQFGALPGDKFDAASHWTGASNGDGDGFINMPLEGVGTPSEPYQFWLHLQLDGSLPIRMTGANDDGASVVWVPGVNVPMSKIENAGWVVGYDLAQSGDAFNVPASHFLLVGAPRSSKSNQPFDILPFLTPGEALGIDTKVDDAEPATGNIVALFLAAGQCTQPDSGAVSKNNFDAGYRAFDETRRCAIAFTNAFGNNQ
jgi:type II secretory pathway pseudopilin PulG